ncbi:glycosyltransferase [Pseudopelagicola sp. nBUS_19]|uniref:glycosyltransferase n=1 Tax=unclassified Pseudopelagicola TaxID=2649563 RepID=UPI003EB9CE44
MSCKLLIYAPVPLYQSAGQFFLEAQAAVALRLWANNFASVDVMMPVIDALPPEGWVPYETDMISRVTIHAIPAAYTAWKFLMIYPETRRQISQLIGSADVLCFAIGGLIGDWGAVAGFEAYRQGKRFAVWTDRVESAVTRLTANQGPLKTRIRKRLTAGPMWACEKAVIRRAGLGLFHGRDTFETYARFSEKPHVVHDVLLDTSYQVTPERFSAKKISTTVDPLRIIYVGRADIMKGPFDWIQTLKKLDESGVPFDATWLGAGPELEEMRQRVLTLGLASRVRFSGFVNDRGLIMREMESAHVFMFCHKTPESPRCLIEALMAGTPIVGYDGAYARDLTANHGGGEFVPLGDTLALGEKIVQLASDRESILELQNKAFRSGRQYDQDSVYEHRSRLLLEEFASRVG